MFRLWHDSTEADRLAAAVDSHWQMLAGLTRPERRILLCEILAAELKRQSWLGRFRYRDDTTMLPPRTNVLAEDFDQPLP